MNVPTHADVHMLAPLLEEIPLTRLALIADDNIAIQQKRLIVKQSLMIELLMIPSTTQMMSQGGALLSNGLPHAVCTAPDVVIRLPTHFHDADEN